jgi:hypothetical protein
MTGIVWAGVAGSIAETANGGYVAAVTDRKNSAIVGVRGCCAGVLGYHKNR